MNTPTQPLLAQAHHHHANGDLEDAGRFYEEAVTHDPNCGDAWYGLGTLALQVGDPVSAIDLLNRAIECDSTISEYFCTLGEAYRRNFNVEAAIAVLRVACELRPNLVDAWINLGVAYGDTGDLAAAEEALHQAAEHDATRADIYRNLGVLKQKQGASEEAEANYRLAISLFIDDIVSWRGLGETLADAGRPLEAVEAYRNALNIYPGDISTQIGMAMALSLAGDRGTAEQILAGILQDNPKNHEALMAQGQMLMADKQESAAISCLQAAIEADPLHDAPYRLLSALLSKRGEHAQAGELMLRALSILPKDVSIMRQLAEIYQRMGEHLAAIALLRQAVAMAPEDHKTLYALGQLLVGQDKLQDGETQLRKATELSPESVEYWTALGWALYRLDRMEDALAAFDEGEARCPNSNAIANNRGAVMFDYGRFEEALELFGQGLKRNPNDPVALGNIALVQSATNQLRDAAKNFSKALSLIDRENPRAASLLFNFGTLELQRGKLQRGWEMYSHRESAKYQDHMDCPPWRGEDLRGKTILIWQDQGVGDQIMFGGMYQEVIDQAERVFIDCHPKVLPLLRRSFPRATVFPRRNPPHALMQTAFDYRAAAGDLPRWLRPTLASFPRSRKGILQIDPLRKNYWRERLATLSPYPKIGICWRSKLQTTRRSQQYAQLEDWLPLLQVPGVTFINLQYDNADSELQRLLEEHGIDVIRFPELDMHDDLDETSAMISALDLVISAPTAVAMMASAIGKTTWNVLADYSWTLLGTKRHPFMPAIEKIYARNWNVPWRDYLAQAAHDVRQRFQVDL